MDITKLAQGIPPVKNQEVGAQEDDGETGNSFHGYSFRPL
jgi:hypothetical protein